MTREQAEQIADTIFRDLRDRRFVKWLFAEHADSMGPILHERDGTPLMPISEAVQAEIRTEWIEKLMKLLKRWPPCLAMKAITGGRW